MTTGSVAVLAQPPLAKSIKSFCISDVKTRGYSANDEVESTNSSTATGGVDNASNQNSSLVVPSVAVYASNYNFTVMAAAVMMMDAKYAQAFEQNQMKSTIKMLCYAGAVVGQCTMGYAGDIFGRRNGMILTLLLVFVGALGSAVCCWGSTLAILWTLAVFRFILGFGNGGVYPLSAVTAAEGTASSKAEERSPRVSYAYFFNAPGIISPFVLGLILHQISNNVETNWRILVGFGAIPVLCIVVHAFKARDSEEFVRNKGRVSLWNAIKNTDYWTRLIGTGWCWFLYDVFAYGILLIQTDITSSIWGSSHSVTDALWQGAVLNGLGIPGALSGILVVKQMGTKWLQFWGFIGMGFSAICMGAALLLFPHTAWLQMVCLALVNFMLNWGAAVTTFILPSEVFPPECRSTYNGICAALGKIGAVLGIYAFAAILRDCGMVPLFACAALTAYVGAVLTWFFVGTVPKTWRSACVQCFGSLLACIPFFDPRPRMGW